MADYAAYVVAGVAVISLASATYSIIQSGKTTNVDSHPEYSGVSIQTSSYGYCIPVAFGTSRLAGNLIWAGDFKTVAHSEHAGKGGGGIETTSYTYQLSFAVGLSEGEIDGVGKMWIDKKVYDSVIDSGVVFAGGTGQAPWSYLTANHADEALYYPKLAYFAIVGYDMGNSNYLPNFNYEIKGRQILAGLNDANPGTVIYEIVTDQNFGLGLSETVIDITDYYNYCMAANLLLSPTYTSRSAAHECIRSLCAMTNSEITLHDGEVLKIVPYGDTALTGNGVTWTPNLTPVYDLTDDDFLHEDGEEPIKVTRKSPADAFNQVTLQYKNRDNDYNNDTVTALDQGNIDLYGLRPDSTTTADAITQTSVAQTVAALLLQRDLFVINTFEFKLGWKYCRLEPLDIVTLTDTILGLDEYPVRITGVEDDENGMLSITAEDLGIGSAPVYSTETPSGYHVNFSVDPGDIDAPVIFDAPGIFTDTDHEVWCAISGSDTNWGGCRVYVSTDGVNYKYIGNQLGKSRYGVLSDTFASGSDPDTTNTCPVDLTISTGTLLSGTQDDADNNVTLCKVGNELIAYETATLTGAYSYDLTDYLRRGIHTAITSHAASSSFVRLDDQVFKYAYDKTFKGKTIYIKFQSFNIFQHVVKDLADVTPYTFTIGGSISYPSNVTNFVISEGDGALLFTWDDVADKNVSEYEIRYGYEDDGESWDEMAALPQTLDWRFLAVGNWVFAICAKDKSGNYSLVPATVVYAVTE